MVSALPISCAPAVAQAGGSGPAMSGFRYGAGRVVAILVAVPEGGVLVAPIRARRTRK